jgi:tetratricopeptide (TPR) repeat protein
MKRLVLVLGLVLAGSLVLAQAPEPGALERYAEEGQKALAEGRWADAAGAYEKLRDLSPETAEVHAQLGMIRFRLRDFSGAVPALREALKLKPSLPNVDVLLAMCLSEVGQYEEALPGLEKGFKQTSGGMMRRATGLALQRSYHGLGQDDEAVDVALQLTRLYPDDPEILYHAGRLIANHAYLLTLRLAEVAPASVWMHQAAGEANESIANYDGALEDYRKALVLEPDRPGIHYRLGRVHLARARPPLAAADAEALAAQEFEAELRIDPTNANAAYELGELRRKEGDLVRARELFAQAVEHYPEFEQGHVGLGRVLIAQGHPDLALPHLENATGLDPEDDVAFFHLWQAHRALGHADEEKRVLAEFQRLRNKKREEERLGLLRRYVVTQQELEEEMTPP